MTIIEPGTPAPAFTLKTEDRENFTREDLAGQTTVLVSDFEPKGAASRAFGAYFEPAGMTNRALVIVGPDQVVAWSHLADSPGDLPAVNLIFDGLQAAPV